MKNFNLFFFKFNFRLYKLIFEYFLILIINFHLYLNKKFRFLSIFMQIFLEFNFNKSVKKITIFYIIQQFIVDYNFTLQLNLLFFKIFLQSLILLIFIFILLIFIMLIFFNKLFFKFIIITMHVDSHQYFIIIFINF